MLQYLVIDNPCISYKYKYFEKTICIYLHLYSYNSSDIYTYKSSYSKMHVTYIYITLSLLKSVWLVSNQYALAFTKNHLIDLVWVLSPKQKSSLSLNEVYSAWNPELWFSTRLYFWTYFLTICKHNVRTNLPQAVSEIGSYLCTGNMCISYEFKDFEKIDTALTKKISSICYGFIENKFANSNSLFSPNKMHSFFKGKDFNRA